MNRTLLIISHTRHFVNNNGKLVGWAPTIREVDEIAELFDKVIHAACLYHGEPLAGLTSYKNSKIEFVPLPPFGGKGFRKLSVIYTIPIIVSIVFSQLKRSTHFQFRAPTSMGVYLIPLLTWFSNKKGWFKYAGNWVEENPPLSYAFQRTFLSRHQKRIVTINGRWKNQPAHCISFDNPCLDEYNLISGNTVIVNKKFNSPFTLCFSGRLERQKGVKIILDALKTLKSVNLIRVVHFVGDGSERTFFEKIANEVSVPCVFHGFLAREDFFYILNQSDFFVLPSASEGFPKVIAEAVNFGCIPIVSDVSSIPQYINEQNGFLWHINSDFTTLFETALETHSEILKLKSGKAHQLATLFTYSSYVSRLKNEVLLLESNK